jgi:hypothetical protein
MRSAAPGMHSPPNASEASPATPTWNRSRFRQVGMSCSRRRLRPRAAPAAGRCTARRRTRRSR